MFDYTRSILSKTKRDIDILVTAFTFSTQVLYIAYLLYMLISGSNIWHLHLSLLIISCAFLVFDVCTAKAVSVISKGRLFPKNEHRRSLSDIKKRRRIIRRIKFCITHSLKLLVIAASVYTIIADPYSVHPISIIFTTVMVLMWMIQILLEAVRLILNSRLDLFSEALRADFEFVTKPVDSVKNTFRKFMGKDVKDEREPTKERTYLDSVVEKFRAKKAEEKNEKKADHGERLSDWLDSYVKGFKRKSSPVRKGDDTIVLSADEVEDKSEV